MIDQWKTEEVNTVTNSGREYEEFLGDTGVTTHIVKNNSCIMNPTNVNLGGMKVGTGDITEVTAKGELKVMDENGTSLVLKSTHIVPGITRNIISMTQLMYEG